MSAGEPEQPGTAQRFAADAVRDTLGVSTDVDSCSELAARVDGLLDQALQHFQEGGAGIACRAGCHFCCHLRVMVFPHEAIALFRYLGSRIPQDHAQGIRRRVLENATRISQLTRDGKAVTGVACAFLVDGRCAAYEVRPASCSGYHSLSRERCEQGFTRSGAGAAGSAGPADEADCIPMLKSLCYVAGELDEGLAAAMEASGLSATRVELQTAVAALIRNPTLIGRWRSGRELLKNAKNTAERGWHELRG